MENPIEEESMVVKSTKRSLIIAVWITGMSALFLMVIPSVRSSDTKSNQTGYYLVDILEVRKELPEVQGIPIPPRATGEDAQDIYELRVNLSKGDLVYLEGQVEVTNPTGTNVLLAISIRIVEGDEKKRISHWSTSNVTPGTHHMPLRVSAKYVADKEGESIFLLRAHSGSDSPLAKGKQLVVEGGHGHLLAQVFRPR
jgi:hypothetical protein